LIGSSTTLKPAGLDIDPTGSRRGSEGDGSPGMPDSGANGLPKQPTQARSGSRSAGPKHPKAALTPRK